MNPDDDNRDRRPIPDPTALTTIQLDREIAHLKELSGRDRDAEREARKVALEGEREARRVALDAMDRRLLEIPQLRDEIVKVRAEFVRVEVYSPAHEELSRQRIADGERIITMQSDIKSNATNLARLESSMMWLSRLVIGALISAVILYAFQKLTGR
jgi:hypothetical protein